VGLGERDRDLEAAGEALTLLFLGEGVLLLGGERDAGDLDLRGGDLDLGLRGGLRLSLNAGDLLESRRGGDLPLKRGERALRRGGDLPR